MQQKWVKVTAVILAALMAVSGLGVGLAALIKYFFYSKATDEGCHFMYEKMNKLV